MQIQTELWVSGLIPSVKTEKTRKTELYLNSVQVLNFAKTYRYAHTLGRRYREKPAPRHPYF